MLKYSSYRQKVGRGIEGGGGCEIILDLHELKLYFFIFFFTADGCLKRDSSLTDFQGQTDLPLKSFW